MGEKISGLPVKISAMDTTDLFEVSEYDGVSAYESKNISGQLIIDGVEAVIKTFYTEDSALDSDRVVDLDGFDLEFSNGKIGIGAPPSANALLNVYGPTESEGILSEGDFFGVYGIGNTAGLKGDGDVGVEGNGNSAGGSFDGTVYGAKGTGGTAGVYCSSTGVGYGLLAEETGGSSGAINAQGKVLFNGTAATGSALFQVDSTTQGSLMPRQTEAQMNAIASPATGLQVYNTTRNETMFYHSVFGWIGGSNTISMASATTPTVTTTTYYFSMAGGLAMRTTIGGLAINPTKKGKIISAGFTRFIASTLGNRTFDLYVRVNNTTDYLVATSGTTATETFFYNAAMNTTGITVDITDSIVMKLVVSGGTTDSANVLFFGNLLIR